MVGGVTVPLVNVGVQADDFVTGDFVSDAYPTPAATIGSRPFHRGASTGSRYGPETTTILSSGTTKLTWDEANPVTVAEDPGQVVERPVDLSTASKGVPPPGRKDVR